MGRSLVDMSNIALLMMLFVYIFSLLGMQLFANRMRFDSWGYSIEIGAPEWFTTRTDEEGNVRLGAQSPRANFDSLTWAFTTIFQVLVGEGWNEVFYDARRVDPAGGTFFFTVIILFGAFIVMSLYLAILLSNFGEGGRQADLEAARHEDNDAVGLGCARSEDT